MRDVSNFGELKPNRVSNTQGKDASRSRVEEGGFRCILRCRSAPIPFFLFRVESCGHKEKSHPKKGSFEREKNAYRGDMLVTNLDEENFGTNPSETGEIGIFGQVLPCTCAVVRAEVWGAGFFSRPGGSRGTEKK